MCVCKHTNVIVLRTCFKICRKNIFHPKGFSREQWLCSYFSFFQRSRGYSFPEHDLSSLLTISWDISLLPVPKSHKVEKYIPDFSVPSVTQPLLLALPSCHDKCIALIFHKKLNTHAVLSIFSVSLAFQGWALGPSLLSSSLGTSLSSAPVGSSLGRPCLTAEIGSTSCRMVWHGLLGLQNFGAFVYREEIWQLLA